MQIPRYDTRRVALETVIPLSTPLAIYVDPSTACNYQCGFCPTADRLLMKKVRYVGFMRFELFQKIIDDLEGFDKPVDKLIMYADGEPLLNPHFPEMVRYARQSSRVNKISTTTNGSQLSPALNRRIIEAGLDEIKISIYGMNNAQYRNFSKAYVDFDKLTENIRDLYDRRGRCAILVKINGDVISEEDERRFYRVFEPISTGVSVEHVMACWVQTADFNLAEKGLAANSNVGIYGQPIQDVLVCPYVLYSFTIHPDGTASVCFLDWQRKLLIGDVRIQSVKDIWNGAKMREHQLLMLRGERKNQPICGNCGQMSHGMPDNIDPYRAELLCKLIQIVAPVG